MITISRTEAIPKNARSTVNRGDTVDVYFDDDSEEILRVKNESDQNDTIIRRDKKINRSIDIKTQTVTTAGGNIFDAGIKSKAAITSAVVSMPVDAVINWVMNDNSTVSVDLNELKEALWLIVQLHTTKWEIV